MAGPHLFSWLHLSDIHVGQGGASHEANQRLVLGALRDDVARQIKAGLPRPDVILVTGDVAFSGACVAKDEYDRAAHWLGEIAKAAGVPLEAVYAVPGNHDVQRAVDKPHMAKLVLTGLRSGASTIDDALSDEDTRAHLAKRQASYLAFAERLAPACRASEKPKEPRLNWRHTLETSGGLKVRLVGLNTALVAADERDHGSLRLGQRQLADSLAEPVGPHEVVIVLSHHPFSDGWLHDEAEADRWTRNHAHIHLSGHVHKAENERARSGAGGDFVRIMAGAVHEEASSGGPPAHGYSFGALVEAGGALVVKVWPRMWSQDNADFRRNVHVTHEDLGYAEHRLPRVSLPVPMAAQEPESEPPEGTGGTPLVASKQVTPSTTPMLGRLEVLLNRTRRTFEIRYQHAAFAINLTILGCLTVLVYLRHWSQVDPFTPPDGGLLPPRSAYILPRCPVGSTPSGMVCFPEATVDIGSSHDEIVRAKTLCLTLNPSNEGGGCNDEVLSREEPMHQVRVPAFFLDATEVTNEAFVRWLVSRSEVRFIRGQRNGVDGFTDDAGALVATWNARNIFARGAGITNNDDHPAVRAGFEQYPVVLVTWHAAEAFCVARGGHLPSEEQWERAARGVERREFPWGNAPPYAEGTVFARRRDALPFLPVPRYPSDRMQDQTREGVFDLGGNVAEWTLTVFAPYSTDGSMGPTSPVSPTGTSRVVRGGDWRLTGDACRGAARGRFAETRTAPDVGFRCALPVPQTSSTYWDD